MDWNGMDSSRIQPSNKSKNQKFEGIRVSDKHDFWRRNKFSEPSNALKRGKSS